MVSYDSNWVAPTNSSSFPFKLLPHSGYSQVLISILVWLSCGWHLWCSRLHLLVYLCFLIIYHLGRPHRWGFIRLGIVVFGRVLVLYFFDDGYGLVVEVYLMMLQACRGAGGRWLSAQKNWISFIYQFGYLWRIRPNPYLHRMQQLTDYQVEL